MSTHKPQPEVDSVNGVPFCSESCPLHDGKRCEATGFRPGRICEPAVIRLVEERDEWQAYAAGLAPTDPAPPFTQAERADVLAVASVPPRALRAIAEHLTRCAVKHGVEPHVTRPDRDAQAHMAGADRHLLRMARKSAPGYDLDAIDEDSGAPQLVAVASRVLLALECWLGEREGGRG